MLEVLLPDAKGVAVVVRSFAACLAAVTETPVAQVPQPVGDLPAALGQWRNWLAGRGAGLAPIAEAARFNWPGYWIAVLDRHPGAADEQPVVVVMFGTPAGVVLSPQAQDLLGLAARELPVRQGYLVASLDPALGVPAALPHLRGKVAAIAVAKEATGRVSLVPTARALPGRGLAGDRYAARAGTFTPVDAGGRGYDLTLIQTEVLDALLLPDDRQLGYAEARRNLVTRGIDLNALVGRRFRVGDVECMGQRLCEPCAHLERLTTRGVLRGLIHRGGLRADVLTGGHINTGDIIQTID
jgi:MOSC domain-containing protein YiiM